MMGNRSIMHWLSIGLAVLGAAPLIVLAVAGIREEVPRFFDPCTHWGMGHGEALSPSAACPQVRGISETKTAAIVRLLIFQGSMLLTAIAALCGASLQKRWLIAGAFALLCALSVPLLPSAGSGFLTLSCAIVFLASYFLARSFQSGVTV
jgi:hypothetical protein